MDTRTPSLSWLLPASPLLLGLLLGCPVEETPPPVLPCSGAPSASWDGSALAFSVADCADVELAARVLGEGELSVSFAEVDGAWVPTISSAGGGTFTGLVLEGPWAAAGDEAATLWRQGYQSWSFSGVIPLEALELDADGVPEVGGDGGSASVIYEEPGTSWWVGLVGRPGGASLLLGAQAATKTRFFAAFDAATAWAVWGHRGESVALAPGESLALDPLVLGAGLDAYSMHVDYAEAVARRVAPRPLPPPPLGWATWYHYFGDVTEADVRANLEVAVARSMDLFQIDDGWQRLWGHWTADDGFPSGMAGLAGDIADAGLTPGLWMAPLYVDRGTDTWAAHPDWWVRNEAGEQLSFSNLGTGDYAVLDVTQPDAAAWLDQTIRDRVAEGWTYFKFDFLYAAAQEGQRHEDVTGIEAYGLALQILREAAGDAWILACGAPMLPSVGFAESYRSGADIAFDFDRRPERPYLRWRARASAARNFTNGLWWWIDADQILVREPFTEVEATGSVVANAVSGGVWMLGDDLPTLPGPRLDLALAPELVALRGQTPVPEDPLRFPSGLDGGPLLELAVPNDRVPTRWRFPGGEIALLNLGDASIQVEGPGGRELISGETAEAGARVLPPGAGEIWAP